MIKMTDDHGGRSKVTPDCLRPVQFMDVQWSNCPQEVEGDVRELWKDQGLGNDVYIWKYDVDDLSDSDTSYPILQKYLKERGCKGTVIIHWWW